MEVPARYERRANLHRRKVLSGSGSTVQSLLGNSRHSDGEENGPVFCWLQYPKSRCGDSIQNTVLAVTQNHPPGVESRGFKITHPEKVKGLARRLRSRADFGHAKLSQDGLGQRNSGAQKQRLVEATHRPGAPDRPADGAQIPSRRFKLGHPFDPRRCAG